MIVARVNLSVPDDVLARVRADLPGVNLSATLREALGRLLRCSHDELVCSMCAGVIERRVMLDDVLGRFYDDAMWELRTAIAGGGTLEGFGTVLKRVATGYGVSKAATTPLPRSTRVERRRALDAKVATLPDRARRRRSA